MRGEGMEQKCPVCGEETSGIHKHHIIPKSVKNEGSEEPSNFMKAGTRCHFQIHAAYHLLALKRVLEIDGPEFFHRICRDFVPNRKLLPTELDWEKEIGIAARASEEKEAKRLRDRQRGIDADKFWLFDAQSDSMERLNSFRRVVRSKEFASVDD